VDVHFCPQCTKILSLHRHGDYFSFLGVPRKLNLDADDLERRFRSLSRQFHPDYFYNASTAERRASLERSSYLNDAYRTLRNPIARIEYLLEREGFGTAGVSGGGGRDQQAPASLLEEVFALNEELDEIRTMREQGAPTGEWLARLESARKPIEEKRDAHEAELRELGNRWDALNGSDGEARRQALGALRERMLERNYINNLLATIEQEKLASQTPRA
jgi:molecular chaperone HscB